MYMNQILDNPIFSAIVGGILIGISVSLMLALNGRALGISGILSAGILNFRLNEKWRLFFLIGLLGGGAIIFKMNPQSFISTLNTPKPILILAGFLVGFGTRLGGGCTSGHGICGVSRLSMRSIIATITFMIFGMLTATLLRKLNLL